MAKLYELTQNYNNLLELLDNPDISREMIDSALNETGEEIDTKAENIVKVIKSLEVDISGNKEEEKRMADRRKSLENRVNGLKEYLDAAMKATGKEKIKGKVFTISYQKNPPSVDIKDEKAIPKEYFIAQDPALDKKQLLADLKAGKEIDGAAIKQTMGLRIK